jgi:DNA-binding NarL/FixJ family response regulator
MDNKRFIKIVITDDHDVYRRGLKLFINDKKGMKVTEEYNSGNALLNSVHLEKSDILLLDISMPGINGLEIIKVLKNRKKNINKLILSMHESLPAITKAFEYGASSYILKSSNSHEIIKAIIQVQKKGYYISNYK